MLTDRYGLALSTSSPLARDAYVERYDLLFPLWPDAAEAFARATAEDAGFALAHLGSAQAFAMLLLVESINLSNEEMRASVRCFMESRAKPVQVRAVFRS